MSRLIMIVFITVTVSYLLLSSSSAFRTTHVYVYRHYLLEAGCGGERREVFSQTAMLMALSTSLGLFSRPSLRLSRYWAAHQSQSHSRKGGLASQHTHLGARRLPYLENTQASLCAHCPDFHFIMLMRVEPLELLASDDHLARGSELDVALGAEEPTMSALTLIELGASLPVVGAEPLLT